MRKLRDIEEEKRVAAEYAELLGFTYEKIKISKTGGLVVFKQEQGGSGGWIEGTPAIVIPQRIIYLTLKYLAPKAQSKSNNKEQ